MYDLELLMDLDLIVTMNQGSKEKLLKQEGSKYLGIEHPDKKNYRKNTSCGTCGKNLCSRQQLNLHMKALHGAGLPGYASRKWIRIQKEIIYKFCYILSNSAEYEICRIKGHYEYWMETLFQSIKPVSLLVVLLKVKIIRISEKGCRAHQHKVAFEFELPLNPWKQQQTIVIGKLEWNL